MGNSANTSAFETRSTDYTALIKSYSLISQSTTDKKFGEINLYEKNGASEDLVWIKELFLETNEAYQAISQYIDEGKHKSERFLTKEAKFIVQDSSICGVCSLDKRLVVFMEYFERDLEGELFRRAEDKVRKEVKKSS